nr:hypothetical protein [Snodgrassella alvi]
MKIKFFWSWLFFLLNIGFIADAKIIYLHPDYAEFNIYQSIPEEPNSILLFRITPKYITKYKKICAKKNNVTRCEDVEAISMYTGINDFFDSIPKIFLAEKMYDVSEFDRSGYKIYFRANKIDSNFFNLDIPERKDEDVAEFLDKFNQLLTGKSKYQLTPVPK